MSDNLQHNKDFLHQVYNCLEARNLTYGDAKPLFENVADRWHNIFKSVGHPSEIRSSAKAVLAMLDLKVVRFRFSRYTDKDTLVDIAGYAAILHDLVTSAEREKNDKN